MSDFSMERAEWRILDALGGSSEEVRGAQAWNVLQLFEGYRGLIDGEQKERLMTILGLGLRDRDSHVRIAFARAACHLAPHLNGRLNNLLAEAIDQSDKEAQDLSHMLDALFAQGEEGRAAVLSFCKHRNDWVREAAMFSAGESKTLRQDRDR